MTHTTPLIYPAFCLLLGLFVFVVTRYLNLLERHRRAKVNYQLIAERAKAVIKAIHEFIPNLSMLQGESFIAGLRKALFDLIEVQRKRSWTPAGRVDHNGLSDKASDMLTSFLDAMANKMQYKEVELHTQSRDPFGWMRKTSEWPIPWAQEALLEHLAKGDPIDVALFCAFLWYHQEETSLMGYMSVTPTLLEAIQAVRQGVPIENLNALAESKLH